MTNALTEHLEYMQNTHTDDRGIIKDLLVTKDYSITHITFRKGAVRGNHYHEQTLQEDVVLKGQLLVVQVNKIRVERVLQKGDSITHVQGVSHAYQALEDSEILSICFGVRRGSNYEKDTIRLEKPLL